MRADTREPNWLTLHREAVREQDPKQLRVRIVQAQRTIRRRPRELWYAGAPDTGERQRTDAACQFLGILCPLGAIN